MPIEDDLINKASGNKMISFLDGNIAYNQISMAEQDMSKTAFRCPGFVGLFEWIVMTFGLKNAGATYQRAMNLIFHDLLGVLMEVYIDDLVIKLAGFEVHMANLKIVLERMRVYNLKMNPMKCAFCVTPGKFLGFTVHERGIEIDPKKVELISKLEEPTCKWDVQKLLGKINYLRWFIANLAGKIDSFLPLVRMKHEGEFTWGEEHKEAFEKMKKYLMSLRVLRVPKANQGFRLYVAVQEHVIGSVLTQEEDGKEFSAAYLSRRLMGAESRYAFIEKMCLSLYYACTKLRWYLLMSPCTVVCQHDVLKCMLQRHILSGRIGKWAYALIEYDLRYEPLRAMKGQVIADFIVDHGVNIGDEVCLVEAGCWTLFINGSVCGRGQGIGYIIISPHGLEQEFATQLEFACMNNQAEYESLLSGLELLVDIGARRVGVFSDSKLTVHR
jgi:hypothetical protein